MIKKYQASACANGDFLGATSIWGKKKRLCARKDRPCRRDGEIKGKGEDVSYLALSGEECISEEILPRKNRASKRKRVGISGEKKPGTQAA